MWRPRQGTNDVKQQSGCLDMPECWRGDGGMRSAAGGMISVIRGANETGSSGLTWPELLHGWLCLRCLTLHFLEMMRLFFHQHGIRVCLDRKQQQRELALLSVASPAVRPDLRLMGKKKKRP